MTGPITPPKPQTKPSRASTGKEQRRGCQERWPHKRATISEQEHAQALASLVESVTSFIPLRTTPMPPEKTP